MAQFDIYLLKPRVRTGKPPRMVVVLQSALLEESVTRIVAPIMPNSELAAVGASRPRITLGKKGFRIAIDQLTLILARDLGMIVGSADALEYEIKRALDEVFFGV